MYRRGRIGSCRLGSGLDGYVERVVGIYRGVPERTLAASRESKHNGWTSHSRLAWVTFWVGISLNAEPQRRTGPMKKLLYIGLDVHKTILWLTWRSTMSSTDWQKATVTSPFFQRAARRCLPGPVPGRRGRGEGRAGRGRG